jgi:antitoxin MazE
MDGVSVGYTSGILKLEGRMATETKIHRWGNSQGVRFPKHLLEEVGLAVGDGVLIEAGESGIVVRPLKRRARKYRIADLVAQMPADYQPGEEDWGSAEGREVW